MIDRAQFEKQTVVFVLGGLNFGGNESHAISLLKELDRERFDPILISLSDDDGPTRNAAIAINVPVFTFPLSHLGFIVFVRQFSQFVRTHQVSSVLSFTFSKLHLFVMTAAILGGARHRIAIASASPINPDVTRRIPLLQFFSRFTCTHEVAVSEWVKSWLQTFGYYPPSRILVIPNGCDVTNIRRRAQRASVQKKRQSKRIIMVARLEAAKDHETLLTAMAIVRKQVPSAQLYLVGDGPLRSHLEGLSASCGCDAHFLGSRSDVPELLGISDVFVLSTHSEGSPIALIEAMACGLPLVASDIPPCREVLDDGRAGLLFPVGDVEQLSEHLINLLQNDDLRSHYEAASANRAKHYSMANSCREYEHLFKSC